MRCLTFAAWLASGSFKSLCAKAIWPRPATARHRISGLNVIVFILWRLHFPDFRYSATDKLRHFGSDQSAGSGSFSFDLLNTGPTDDVAFRVVIWGCSK